MVSSKATQQTQIIDLTKSSLYLIPLTLNLLQVLELLIVFLIGFLFIYLVKVMTNSSNLVFNNSIIQLLNHQILHQIYLLLQMPVSKTTSLSLLCIYMFATSQLSKCFITLSTLQAPKLNFLPLDVVLTKLSIYMVFLKSLLSQIQFMWQKRFLILHLTHSKSIWLSSSMTLESFLLVIKRT